MKRIGDDCVAAVTAGCTQVVKTLQVSALALPVANGKIHEGKLGYVAKIGDGENGLKNGLQSAVVALARQLVHLQEAVIGTLLYLNEVRYLQGCRNLGEIETITGGAILIGHDYS